MKTLTLIRHAKSSWAHDVTDHQRPLKTRGLNDANLISTALKNLNFSVNYVMVSDAIRTKMTADIILPNLKIDKKNIVYNHDLYDFSGRNLVNTIKNCPNSIDKLMVFGHNHAITDFANTYGSKYISNVPTCGVVVIAFSQTKWSGIKSGNTVRTLFPRDLK